MPQIYFVLIFSKQLVTVKLSLSTRAVYLNPFPPTLNVFYSVADKKFSITELYSQEDIYVWETCVECVAETLHIVLQ